MSLGIGTALNEITLVLFTTLAPSGVVSFVLMGGSLLFCSLTKAAWRRLNMFLIVPIVVTMLGLITSATHLGNPANALYVFLGVGRSPLSNEVFFAVLFLSLAGLYWLYAFAEHPKPCLQRFWLGITMIVGIVFVVTIAYAYAAPTIISWYTPYVPFNLIMNACMGGPVLAVAGICAAGCGSAQKRLSCIFIVVAALAFVINIVGFSLQGMNLFTLENSFITASELVPCYGIMTAVFSVLCVSALGFDIWALWGQGRLTTSKTTVASLLVLAGISIMRFAFYMMHMTTGLGV